MKRWWAGWVALTSWREAPQVMAGVRVLVATVLLYDFLYLWHLGLVEALFSPEAAGGFPDVHARDPVPEIYRWFPETQETARAAWAVMVGALACMWLGVATPVACLVAALTSAQLSQVLPLGDRGIDMLLRNVLVLLAFAPSGKAWSVDAWVARKLGRPFAAEQPAWGRYALVLQLAVMYFLAGIQKTALAWTPFGGYSALFSILQDPSIARHRFGWLADWYPLTQLASASTMLFEYTACLVPLAFWYRLTPERPGRVRAWVNRVHPLRFWLGIGIGLHLGIAATMQLGIFPGAILSLYPAFFSSTEWRRGVWRG